MVRKDVAVIEQVLELKKMEFKTRAIARSLGISRNTVKKILREYAEKPRSCPVSPEGQAAWDSAIDWSDVGREHRKGVSLKILHSERAPVGISYNRFWYAYRKKVPQTPIISMRLTHNAGEKTFFDFTQGIDIVNRVSGQSQSTQLLIGVLQFSSLTYGEFLTNERQAGLMSAIQRAFKFFGGVTPYVTVDNLKAGVTKAHLYDPVVNPGFVAFANHWGFAVIPARPYKPRDKASNESGIGVIQRSFFQQVRNQTFYSLDELNQTLRKFLDQFNGQIMKEHGASRWERFQNEKNLLKSLAPTDFEPCEWRSAKVHPDCHIQLENKFYSVPFHFVGRVVRVRLTARMVEVFSEDLEAIASHARLLSKERVSTLESHYPEHKTGLTRFEVKHAKSEADRIGPETRALMDQLFDTQYPLKYLRRAQGILRLVQSGQVSREALEHACKQGRQFQKTQYDYIKATAKFFQFNGNRPIITAPKRELSQVHLHRN